MHYSWIAQISRFNLHTVLKNSIYCPKIGFWQNLLSEFLRLKNWIFFRILMLFYRSIFWTKIRIWHTVLRKRSDLLCKLRKDIFEEAVFNLSFYKFRGKPKMITFTKKTPIFDPFYFRIVSRVDWQDLLFIPTVSKSSESCKKCESTDAAQCLKFTLKRLIWWK